MLQTAFPSCKPEPYKNLIFQTHRAKPKNYKTDRWSVKCKI